MRYFTEVVWCNEWTADATRRRGTSRIRIADVKVGKWKPATALACGEAASVARGIWKVDS
jgi:hypothetical protein